VQGDNLWAGTTKGLVLRDKITGELCGIFNTSNSPIPTNHVYDLKIGPDGDLWIATHENVVRFDGNNFTVEAEGLVTEIAFDDQGQLMKATRIYTDICLLNFATSEILGTTPFVSSVVSNISGQNYFTERELFCSGSPYRPYEHRFIG